ncbi:MAG: SusC/RagA family TonB-linked outer membrane protein [Bacteroidales bacterium]|nr:SusC/RagA family TonB-linked outer membrane protein [Bacteroidales bacterium]
MKALYRLTLAVSLLLAGVAGYAQNKTISGKVLDERSEPLPGATLVTAGSKDYAITDANGRFSMQVRQGQEVTVSYLGYDDYVFSVTGASQYAISMRPSEATLLNESVAIGYGTTTKKEVTGSVTSLRSDDFDKGAFTSPAGMLQGKVAGLQITNPNGGDPNGSFEILLRGTNTLSAGQGPLIIIDGVVDADLSTINFQEVESIDVLKDGSAAAIYGTRGTNGVIIITTKRARSGRTSVEYDGQVTVQTVLSRAKPMSAQNFRDAVTAYVKGGEAYLYGGETDWFEQITRTPISHKHSLAISGGSDKFSHRTVLNVERNQGILQRNDANKYLFKTNIHQEALDGWLVFDYNLSYAKRQYNGTRSGIFRQAFFHNPTEYVYDPDDTANGGYFTVTAMDYYNPVAMLNERNGETEVDMIGVNGRATLNIKPVKGLKWDNFVSYGITRRESRDYKTRYYPGETGMMGSAEIENAASTDLQYETTLNYSNTFDNQTIQAILGYTYQTRGYRNSWMYNYSFDTDYFGTDNIGSGYALKDGMAEMSSSRSSSKYIAFFGRVMYNYADKYLASVSLRRDGSSRFGAQNKWGWFPAVSVGWRISQEEFMKSLTWLDELKLRAGYGVTGNQDFDNYRSLFLMATSGHYYSNGKWYNTYVPANNANPDLGWEKKAEFNVGVDISTLKGRLGGTIDYYYRLTTDLLYGYAVPVPPYDYKTFFTNVGSISNSGIEVTINAIPVQSKDWEWNTTLIFSRNTNKLVKFTNEEFKGQEYRIGWVNTPLGVYSQRLMEGESLGSFYGPVFLGTDATTGDAIVSTDDENQWGRLGSAYPDFNLGWSNSLRWGNLTVSATLRAAIGGKVLNQMRGVYENITNMGLQNIQESWLYDQDYTGGVVYSSKYLEDATYLKLDNVSITYNIPFNNPVIKGLRVYATAQNVFILTNYTGVDPEVSLTGLAPGIAPLSYYPRTRSFTLGASLTF